MTPSSIFRLVLQDEQLLEECGISKEEANRQELYRPSKYEIIEVIRVTILEQDNNTGKSSINNQIKQKYQIS
jgi:hypothetical protein